MKAFDLEQFTLANIKRCEAPNGFNHKLEDWSLSDWMTAILGELGEAANIVKKLNRLRDGIINKKGETEEELKEALGKELADAFIYLNLTMVAAGFNPGTIIAGKFSQTSREIGYDYEWEESEQEEVEDKPEAE